MLQPYRSLWGIMVKGTVNGEKVQFGPFATIEDAREFIKSY